MSDYGQDRNRVKEEQRENTTIKVMRLEKRIAALEAMLKRALDIAAYTALQVGAIPIDIFIEPTKEQWAAAHEVLKAAGLSLDAISGSNVRHVVDGMKPYSDELEAEIDRWKTIANKPMHSWKDRAESAEAKVARVEWTVKKWRALNGLSITVGEVLADCANEITEALQEPEHE
jgi:hypothetical protein